MMIAVMVSLLLLIAAALDATRYIIPNWLNGLLLLLYPAMLFTVPGGMEVSWLHGLYAFGAMFVAGYLLFAFNVMGGGDIKLLCVLSLWTGFGFSMLNFILYSAILGGLLTLFLLFARFFAGYLAARMDWPASRIPRVFTYHEPLPYGIAIGAGFAILLWSGDIPGLKELAPYGKAVGRLF